MNYGFDDWPFAVVPDDERASTLWAGRAAALSELNSMRRDWQRSRNSTIHLIWADLGAGKTHTLRHLAHVGAQTGDFRPIYALLPNSTTSFLSLYSSIVSEMDWDAVRQSFQRSGNWVSDAMDVALTWQASQIDSTRRNLASRWLRAERLTARECERLGVPQRLSTVDHAVDALTVVIRSLSAGGQRVVLMIDEYQRVAEGTRKQLQEVGHGVHTVFNACPRDLSLILSCASGGSDVEFVLTPELVSRLSLRRVELPYLGAEDVVVYIRELFTHYRQDPNRDPFEPFTDESVTVIASFLIEDGRLDLTPRGVNEAFDFVLSALEESKPSTPFTGPAVSKWLSEHGDDLLDRIVA